MACVVHQTVSLKAAEKKRPPIDVCPRYCVLADCIAKEKEKLTIDLIKETHKKVDAVQPIAKGSPRAPGRTLWHALYVPEQRAMEVSVGRQEKGKKNTPISRLPKVAAEDVCYWNDI